MRLLALTVSVLLGACVTVTTRVDCDGGAPPNDAPEFSLEGWVGTYDGPLFVVDECTNTEHVWNMTVRVTSTGHVAGLCDLPLVPTGEDTATLEEARCAAPARRAWGWARRSDGALIIDGFIETDCATQRWLYTGYAR